RITIAYLAFLLVCTHLFVTNHKHLRHLQVTCRQSHLPRSQPSVLPHNEEAVPGLRWRQWCHGTGPRLRRGPGQPDPPAS
ncbi:hypothetical protein KIL84_013390, partial [Mauremys mutica]